VDLGSALIAFDVLNLAVARKRSDDYLAALDADPCARHLRAAVKVHRDDMR
jgi:hypothetical protein